MSVSTRGGDHISDRQRWAARLVTIISIGIMTPPLHTSNQEAVITGAGASLDTTLTLSFVKLRKGKLADTVSLYY